MLRETASLIRTALYQMELNKAALYLVTLQRYNERRYIEPGSVVFLALVAHTSSSYEKSENVFIKNINC